VSQYGTDLLNTEVDGFRVLRVLGDAQSPRTLLVRRSDSAEKAVLKFISPDSLEAQILQQVSSPYIAQFLGSGVDESATGGRGAYILMADYGQVGLRTQLTEGMSVNALLALILQLADALDSVHRSGFVLANLRPEHVLRNSNGQPVIVSLGSGFVAGGLPTHLDLHENAPYLSPELISALTGQGPASIDGASDFYSLGVMTFELLSGRLPYPEDTAEAVRQATLHDTVPKLPTHLQALQPLVDGLMAKEPGKRLRSHAALLGVVAKLGLDDEVGAMVIRDGAITSEELSALFADLRLRPGELERQNRRLRRKRRRRIALQGTLSLLLTGSLLAGAFTFREELLPIVEEAAAYIGIIENPELTAAWREAQSLASDPNQGLSAIVAAYQRVLDIAPEYVQAAQALNVATSTWKQSIANALMENDLERAQVRLNEALGLFANDPELTVLSLRLQNRYRAERLFSSTQSLLRSSGLSDQASAAAAVQAYEEILRISPDHVGATQGLTDIAMHYGNLAANAAENRQVDQAIRFLQQASSARSDLRDLDRVRELISQATSLQSAMAELVARAAKLRQSGKAIEPATDNAAELYQQVLATDPNNEAAAQGLRQITDAVMESIQLLLVQNNIGAAERLMAVAEQRRLDAIALANMREQIDTQITRRTQIAVALEQASVLFAQGFITAPNGENAVSKLREVLQLDPNNGVAKSRLAACAERLAEVAKEAQAVGMIAPAKAYLQQALSLKPEAEAWQVLLRQW
jgi:tetratricopeptide (TPR) repeat protein